MENHLYRLEIGVALKLTPVLHLYIFALCLTLYFEILQIVVCFLSSCLLILADFPESHNEIIYLIILHELKVS